MQTFLQTYYKHFCKQFILTIQKHIINISANIYIYIYIFISIVYIFVFLQRLHINIILRGIGKMFLFPLLYFLLTILQTIYARNINKFMQNNDLFFC